MVHKNGRPKKAEDMTAEPSPSLVLFGGPAGAGKTTLAAAWCAKRNRAAHIQLDEIRGLIVSGRADPQANGIIQTAQFLLSVKTCCELAGEFLADGFDVAIDDVLGPPLMFEDNWLPYLGDMDWRVVIVHPTLEETLLRSSRRSKRVRQTHTREQHQATSEWPERYRVDTSGLTVDESMELVESVLRQAPLVAGSITHSGSRAETLGQTSVGPGDVWIVTGIPGAGKSTVATLLAKSLPLSAYVPGDVTHDLIVSGRVEPDQEPEDEAERQIRLTQRNICQLARSLSKAGHVPVIDWVVRNGHDLEAFQDGLSGLTIRLVVLAPSHSALEIRKPAAARRWSHLQKDMFGDLKGTGLWIDSTNLSIEETLDLVTSGKRRALVNSTLDAEGDHGS